ncbi:MAG: D-alanine--D-alanine ligase family protein [Candidatus Moranbacteria bacterium]|nr:D-alanine--D-alanine ligase family protein [Candidatus Moranbacteria bacterium]
MKKINLAVIFGGKSNEHEISLKSANEVINSLNADKYDIIPVAIAKNGQWLIGWAGQRYMEANLPKTVQEGGVDAVVIESGAVIFSGEELSKMEIDIVLPIGHGAFIEDGKLQGMLEMLDLPYVFSGTLASALAMNKQKTKLVAKNAGLKVAKEIVLKKGKKYNVGKITAKLGLPVVVKPTESGSSVGINIAKTAEELAGAIEAAFRYGQEVMLEQFIAGRELTVAVMGNRNPKALPVVEIIPKISTFFDYAAKYQQGGSEEVCPADIPEDIRKKSQKYAVKIFQALGCQDLARADFIWSEADNKLYFLEINTIPGMTGTSLAPKAARAQGFGFSEFLDKLIGEGIKRYKLK